MTTESQNSTPSNADEISLKELFSKLGEWYRYLLSKWKLIIGFGILGGLIGLAYAYKSKPIYTATTTFVLEAGDKSSGLAGLGGLASMAGIDLGGGGGGLFQGDNLLEFYKSRKMIQQSLLTPMQSDSSQWLIDRYIQINELQQAWDTKPTLKGLNFKKPAANLSQQRLQDSILSTMVKDITENYLAVNKPDKKLSIVKVEVKAKDETFAKEFNTIIVNKVNSFYKQNKTEKLLINVAILQHKTDSVRRVMNGAIYNAAAVADATPNLNPTRQVQRIAPVQRSQFSAETNKAILATLVQNLEMSKMTLLKETPLIQVIDEPVYPLSKGKVGKLKSLILGGILGGFLMALVLVVRKLFQEVMK